MATTLTDIIKKDGFENWEYLAQYIKDNLTLHTDAQGEQGHKFSEVVILMQTTFSVNVKTGKKLADHLFRTGMLKEYSGLNLL